jgi:hypothetical protein
LLSIRIGSFNEGGDDMRYVVMVVIVVMGLSCFKTVFAINEGREMRTDTSSQRDARGSDVTRERSRERESSREARESDRNRNPFYNERPNYPGDSNFNDMRLRGPFQR